MEVKRLLTSASTIGYRITITLMYLDIPQLLHTHPTKILVWNVKDANSNTKKAKIREMVELYMIEILILLKTKSDSVESSFPLMV